MSAGNKPCNRLYVGYLPPNITQKELEDLFGKYGTITEVRQNRNFAFINYSDEPSAVNALTELSGQTHFGRKIDVQYARPPRNSGGGPDKKEGEQQRDRSPIGGRGGGRGGRGGGGPFNSRGPFGPGGGGGGNSGPFNDQSPFRSGENSGGDRFGGGGRRGEDRPPDLRSLSLPEPWVNQGPTGGGGGSEGPGSGSGPGGNAGGGGGGGGGGGPGPDPWESGNRPGGGGPGGGSGGNDFRPGGGPPDFRGGSDMRGGSDFRDGFRDKGGPSPFGDRGRDSGPIGGGRGGGGGGDGPFGNRDGPPFGGRDSGPPFGGGGGGGRGDGPPFGRDGPPFGGGRDGPPFGGGRDGPPPFGRDGPPFGGGGRGDGPPFGGGRHGPPFGGGGRDGPPFGGGRDGPRGGSGGPMDFRDSPAFRGGGRGDFPPQSSGGWPSGSSEAPPNAEPAPLTVPNSERTNDIEIIVMNKSITDYGEYIETRLKSIGFSVDIMFPNETAPIPRVLGNIASRGTLYAVLVNPQHKINRSLTLLILHGTAQEHRNMLVEDAIVFLNRNYENYTRSCQEKRGPNAPPEQIRHLLELILSSSRQLTVTQFDILIQHFIQEKLKVEPPATPETALPVSQQAELQTRILSILNKNTATAGAPNNSNSTPAPATPSSAPKETAPASTPSPLLKDPSVQRALDSLIQGGNLFRNINNSNANRY